MRAVTIQQFGDPSGMELREVPDPDPAAGEVLIRVEAAGVGGVDAMIRRGTLGSHHPIGMVPGSEVAGTVIVVGPGTDPELVGRRVWAFTGIDGGYAELALAQVGDVLVLPDALSSVDAVTLGSAATVAHFALAHAHTRAGDSVLVRGAAGSIGIAAVELAAQLGARVAVTTSSEDRGERLRALGAVDVLDRAGTGPEGSAVTFDVVIDIVGGADVPTFIDRLAPNGRLVLVGAVAGFPPIDFGMALMQSFQASRSVGTFSLNSVPPVDRDRVRAAQFASAARGELHPVVHEVMQLEDAANAHRQMDTGAVFGRIVLVP
ncbi:NADPH2:quinone reductase [Curtobacterium sp. ZW137]|nr:NADPH2:quinone reductase [Curtobacterium sp. ZW137]